MADATVEITGDDAGENAAETTQVEAVAQTAKDSGAAQQAAQSVEGSAGEAKYASQDAERSAQVSAQAMVSAQDAAMSAQLTASEVVGAIQSLSERFDSFTAALASSTPAPSAEELPTPVVEVQESSPAKGHWLTRKVGRK